ncbi:ATP synthase gamma chain [hydrothermal vent metagenome]|uniref:ATP synthase gamma chain n=1 Tax=hydrothermal vent metagenome TaxID=652676 RepID=A0A1W1EJ99_9ZZZZ
MANLKDIKRKISSVSNTQKTTRAMKLVSTAKLKRTEELAKQSKIYANKLTEMLTEIAQNIESTNVEGLSSKFCNEQEDIKVVDIIFITADKGLCGGFNTQTIKRVKQLIETYEAKGSKIRLRAIGRKGIDYFKFNDIELSSEEIGLSSAPSYDKAKNFISSLVEDYVNGVTGKLILVYNGYVNVITQEVRESSLLPLDTTSILNSKKSLSDLEMEPEDDDTLLDALITKYVEYTIHYALIDSLAAEHSSRMQAMDAATNNAKEMVANLNVEYNKARQQAITTELIEIISGVESMK